jgi:hypothetical protein
MKSYSFRHKETGVVHAQRFSTDVAGSRLAAHLANNTPPGYEAVEGELDYQPPQHLPVTHSEVAQAEETRRRTLAAISALEAGSLRALREVALAVPGSLERLRKIDEQIAALREQL